MYQIVILTGNLGKTPEIKTIKDGKKAASFTLATNKGYKNKAGEKVTNTQWHNIKAWDKLAELSNEYLSKGDLVQVIGEIEYREYQSDGIKKYFTEIVANQIKFLNIKGKQEQSTGSSQTSQTSESDSDDLPF